MTVDTILFDLDDTLLHQEDSEGHAIVAALHAVLGAEAVEDRREQLIDLVRGVAGSLWWGHALGGYCRRIGISPGEGLWGRFENDDPGAQGLAGWAAQYRHLAWSRVLTELGITDPLTPEHASAAFQSERQARHLLFPEATSVLERLVGRYRLGMVTNGASDLQWEKIEAAGIARYFDLVVVSGQLGVGKPEPGIFEYAVNQLDTVPDRCVMVGNSLESDIAGAQAAGIGAIWVNRSPGAPRPAVGALTEITSLTELPQLE